MLDRPNSTPRQFQSREASSFATGAAPGSQAQPHPGRRLVNRSQDPLVTP